MPNDALAINRQSEVRELLAQAIFLSPWDELDDFDLHRIERAAAALGVGQPEQRVRESDLHRAAASMEYLASRTLPVDDGYEGDLRDSAARIERVLEGKKP